MSMCVTPRCAKASTTALLKHGMPPTCGDSATPLAPIGWCGDGVTVWSVSQCGVSDGGRQEVVHQAVAEVVAVLVERDRLPERDRERLGQPAVDLALR